MDDGAFLVQRRLHRLDLRGIDAGVDQDRHLAPHDAVGRLVHAESGRSCGRPFAGRLLIRLGEGDESRRGCRLDCLLQVDAEVRSHPPREVGIDL